MKEILGKIETWHVLLVIIFAIAFCSGAATCSVNINLTGSDQPDTVLEEVLDERDH